MSTVPFFAFASTRRRMYEGPLGPYVDELITWLQGQQYTRHSIYCKIQVIADFSRWLSRHRYEVAAADDAHVEQFLKHRKRAAQDRLGDLSALRQMMEILLEKNVVSRSTQPLNERERVEQAFRMHLLQDQGMRPSTPVCYLRHISRFLRGRFGDGPMCFHKLVSTDVIEFVRRDTLGRSYSRAQQTLTAIQSFLRYLRLRGFIHLDLAACVPKAAQWSLAKLPPFLLPSQVNRVLSLCERRSRIGRRNYAMLLLLARLGLRAGEAAALRLDQIDWQHGTLTLRGKGGQWTQMPLPRDVGEAIVDYLKHGRPDSSDRHLFVSSRAPRRGLRNSSSISTIASCALSRARIDCPGSGAHLFRHTLATEMLRQGASLSQIGRLLRHRHPDTTRIYAKVDLKSLRELAMPWPGGAR
jgi:site-specific recombinase XerD